MKRPSPHLGLQGAGSLLTQVGVVTLLLHPTLTVTHPETCTVEMDRDLECSLFLPKTNFITPQPNLTLLFS